MFVLLIHLGLMLFMPFKNVSGYGKEGKRGFLVTFLAVIGSSLLERVFFFVDDFLDECVFS